MLISYCAGDGCGCVVALGMGMWDMGVFTTLVESSPMASRAFAGARGAFFVLIIRADGVVLLVDVGCWVRVCGVGCTGRGQKRG